MTLPQVLEALIFAAPKPLPTADLIAAVQAAGASSESEIAQQYAGVSEGSVLGALEELQHSLEQGGRSFRLMEQAAGWGFVTRGEFAPWVRQLYPDLKPTRLSGPAMETLAIIAYRQPVTRADIEAVRGVAVDGVMQVLLDRSLVRISGRADLPGRPLLYATTGYFLEHFGLKSTQDLPNSSELARISLPKPVLAEERSAKQKEKDEREPELPLDLTPSGEAVPASEVAVDDVEVESGPAGTGALEETPDFSAAGSVIETSSGVSSGWGADDAGDSAEQAECADSTDMPVVDGDDSEASPREEISVVREETLSDTPASSGREPCEQSTSPTSGEGQAEDNFQSHP